VRFPVVIDFFLVTGLKQSSLNIRQDHRSQHSERTMAFQEIPSVTPFVRLESNFDHAPGGGIDSSNS
jgi:hypothetical protein